MYKTHSLLEECVFFVYMWLTGFCLKEDNMKKFLKVALAGGVVCLSANVSAQDLSAMQQEIDTLKEEVLILNRKVYRDKTDSPVSLSSNVSSFGEYDEIIRNLNGKIDEFEYRLKQMDERINTLNADVNTRFNMLEGKPIAAGTGVVSEAKKYGPAVANGAPKSIVGDAVVANQLKDLNDTTKESVDSLYKKGLEALKIGDTGAAEQDFLLILENYPTDKLAGNAQYWLGETYYKDGNYTKAAVAFGKGYEKYKDGNKGADSLYKLGLSMSQLGKKNEACAAFKALPTEFAKAEAELKNKAKTQASKLGCK